MKRPILLAHISAAGLLLPACGTGPAEAPANATDNIAVASDHQAGVQAEPGRAPDGETPPSDQESNMSQSVPPTVAVTRDAPSVPRAEPRPAPPAEPPRRVILPSPIQPPAEVDPPHREPGDRVPL